MFNTGGVLLPVDSYCKMRYPDKQQFKLHGFPPTTEKTIILQNRKIPLHIENL